MSERTASPAHKKQKVDGSPSPSPVRNASAGSPVKAASPVRRGASPVRASKAIAPSADVMYPEPVNMKQWIEDNKHLLQPPVGNKLIYGPETEFQVQIVGGPNTRTDYHSEVAEEFFYQIQGDMLLRVVDGGIFRDIVIREGEVFLLPGNIPHSPQRYPNTVGLVIERKRVPDEPLDGLRWYCSKCHGIVLHDQFHCQNLGTQLKVKIEKYYSTDSMRTCKFCGHLDTKPSPKLTVAAALAEPGKKVRDYDSKGTSLSSPGY
jgi:3-hydroxyanthranilate 3,4-dioxygenase